MAQRELNRPMILIITGTIIAWELNQPMIIIIAGSQEQ